jgi:Tfp pilus assembly protein PilZ
MDEMFKSFRKFQCTPKQERRKHLRKACFIELDYMVRERWYKGAIQDISEGGTYVRSGRRFSPGENILLVIPLITIGDLLRGRLVWAQTHGMGVEFEPSMRDHSEPGVVQKDGYESMSTKESKEMGKIKQRRIRWERSLTEDVIKYRLYWSIGGGVDYHSDHADVGDVTEVVLPGDIPSFPLTSGKFELGISAMNQAGNESVLTKANIQLDFTVPEAPANLRVDDM